MKNGKKVLLIAVCAVLLVVASVMGTLAYLTDSETVTNTFTVGNVNIKLDEAKVNEYGKPLDENNNVVELDEAFRITDGGTNAYHLQPGLTYTKDPTVTVNGTSDNAYVRMMVTVDFQKILDAKTLELELDNIFVGGSTQWIRNAKAVSNVGEDEAAHTQIIYEYRYTDTYVPKAETDTKLDPLFSAIEVPEEFGNTEMAAIGAFTVKVEAHAIQADSFENADAAWAAFKTQNTTTP